LLPALVTSEVFHKFFGPTHFFISLFLPYGETTTWSRRPSPFPTTSSQAFRVPTDRLPALHKSLLPVSFQAMNVKEPSLTQWVDGFYSPFSDLVHGFYRPKLPGDVSRSIPVRGALWTARLASKALLTGSPFSFLGTIAPFPVPPRSNCGDVFFPQNWLFFFFEPLKLILCWFVPLTATHQKTFFSGPSFKDRRYPFKRIRFAVYTFCTPGKPC